MKVFFALHSNLGSVRSRETKISSWFRLFLIRLERSLAFPSRTSFESLCLKGRRSPNKDLCPLATCSRLIGRLAGPHLALSFVLSSCRIPDLPSSSNVYVRVGVEEGVSLLSILSLSYGAPYVTHLGVVVASGTSFADVIRTMNLDETLLWMWWRAIITWTRRYDTKIGIGACSEWRPYEVRLVQTLEGSTVVETHLCHVKSFLSG